MSVRPMTKSSAKLSRWAATAELGARAKALAERERIPLVEAYPKALAAMQQAEWAKEQR